MRRAQKTPVPCGAVARTGRYESIRPPRSRGRRASAHRARHIAHAALVMKSQHTPAAPVLPLLVIGAPLPAVPPPPGVPAVKVLIIGAALGAFAYARPSA